MSSPDGGLELHETPANEVILWAYSSLQNLVESCGGGQPYVRAEATQVADFGTLVSGVSELRGALKGEQTWEKAAAKTLTDSARAYAGGKAGARLGTRFGPWGVVVGTVAGGFAATVGGDAVIDFLEDDGLPPQQPKARVVSYETDDRYASQDIIIDPDANRLGG